MKVLALDFDGVVCDSLRECLATAVSAYQALIPDSPLIARLRQRRGEGRWHALELVDDPVALSFAQMMPLGNRAEDFGISLAASENFLELLDQSAYDTFAGTVDPAWIDAFHDEFYEQRAAARAFDHHGWLDLHAPYPFFSEILRRRGADTTLALATAKDRRSAEILLDHLGLGGIFAPELILDKETGRSKTAHLNELRNRLGVGFDEITFVDDKVNHLEATAGLGIRPVLAGWGFNTPREHELARQRGFAIANIDDAETVLFGGGTID
jgi:phosphoglycolate phosphatase-like HAD superfamily hydrolase